LEFADNARKIHEALLDRRVITGTSSDPKVLRLLPPLCLQKTEIDLFVDELAQATRIF
jgi:4-aminobutyrate aminotransferase-like enzyme